MECYIHPGSTAVGACVGCGQFVCDICRVNVRGKIHCKACLERGEPASYGDEPSSLIGGGAPLYRLKRDKMLGGVCAGVAKYLGLDTLLVRLVWAVLAVTTLVPLILYFVFWAAVPLEPEEY